MTATHGRTALDVIKSDRARLVVALREAGALLADGASSMRCPFHSDKSPSAGIHEYEGSWLFTCQSPSCGWNAGEGTGDVIAVIQATHQCDFQAALARLGVNGHAGHSGTNGNSTTIKPKPSITELAAAEKLATDSAARLMSDPTALDHLWQTRGIDRGTAEKFGLGVNGKLGERFVTMPITDAVGRFVATKQHGLDGQAGGDKGKWYPAGTDKPTQHPFPISLTGDGPIWIVSPLEAAAIIGLSLPAIGYTGGESAKLPDRIIQLVKSAKKSAALPSDDDKAGDKWGARSKQQFEEAGIDVRIVDLDLDASAGLKDVGDFITRELIDNARGADGVRESLLHAYKQSDPWERFTFGGIIRSAATWQPVTYISTGLARFDELAGGGLRTCGAHLLVGKPGQAKTTLAMQIASNAAFSGVSTGIVSLELMRRDLSKLIIAQHTGVERRDLDSGRMDDGYQSVIESFSREHAGAPLVIVDDDRWDGGLDRDKLATLVAEGVKRFGWRLVVLDYLGLLAPGEHDHKEFETELLNSTSIKKLASKHDVAILVVAALRKAANFAKKKEGDKITLDDVSGAGRLTYDATSVWFVEAESQWGQPPSGTLKVRCLKSRFSGAGSLGEVVELHWSPHTGQVSDLRFQA